MLKISPDKIFTSGPWKNNWSMNSLAGVEPSKVIGNKYIIDDNSGFELFDFEIDSDINLITFKKNGIGGFKGRLYHNTIKRLSHALYSGKEYDIPMNRWARLNT